MVYLSTLLKEVKPQFEKDFGRALHDYVWIASVGEARHASHKLSYSIPEINNASRSSTYLKAREFPPTPHNREVIRSIFEDYDWGGGYGGDAWGSIVRALELYYQEETPVGIFIDHCADLQHNNGMAFNKNPNFWDESPGRSEFMSFLNFKRDTDHLLKHIDNVYHQYYLENFLTSKVKKIVNLAWSRFNCLPITYSYLNGEYRSYDMSKLVSYSTKSFSAPISNYRCDYCQCPVDRDSCLVYGGERCCDDCLVYCDHCDSYHHPQLVRNYSNLNMALCTDCKLTYTSTCADCAEVIWDEDLVDTALGLVCQDCAQSYTECGICNELCNLNNLRDVYSTEGVHMLLCEDCGKTQTCQDCSTFFEEEGELYKQLKLKLDYSWAKLETQTKIICPNCVKNHLNAFQPILKLDDKLIIGKQQTELFGLGIKGTPEGQANPISFWDLVKGKQVGQTEMYYAQSFNKLIVSH